MFIVGNKTSSEDHQADSRSHGEKLTIDARQQGLRTLAWMIAGVHLARLQHVGNGNQQRGETIGTAR